MCVIWQRFLICNIDYFRENTFGQFFDNIVDVTKVLNHEKYLWTYFGGFLLVSKAFPGFCTPTAENPGNVSLTRTSQNP